MAAIRLFTTGCAALLAFAATASADDDWQMVNIDGDPAFQMEIPAVVGDSYKTKPDDVQKGMLAFFGVFTDDGGDLYCLLSRDAYTPTLTYETADARLATADRNVLCTAGDGRGDVDVGESESVISNASHAAHCAASYTVASDKQPGHVISVFAIAAPKAFYQLTCTLNTTSQPEATAHWMSFWSEQVRHMEKSIMLPPE